MHRAASHRDLRQLRRDLEAAVHKARAPRRKRLPGSAFVCHTCDEAFDDKDAYEKHCKQGCSPIQGEGQMKTVWDMTSQVCSGAPIRSRTWLQAAGAYEPTQVLHSVMANFALFAPLPPLAQATAAQVSKESELTQAEKRTIAALDSLANVTESLSVAAAMLWRPRSSFDAAAALVDDNAAAVALLAASSEGERRESWTRRVHTKLALRYGPQAPSDQRKFSYT